MLHKDKLRIQQQANKGREVMTKSGNLELKQQVRDQWDAAAQGWRQRDELLREGAAPVSARMLELAKVGPGHHVLDIASGTGEPAIPAAKIVGENGKVIGIDLADEMLDVARDKVTAQGLKNIEFQCIDAETLNVEPGSIDAVTMRWGLMFMPEPLDCLRPAHEALKEGGRISIACWSDPAKNPFVGLLIKSLGQYMEVPTPPPGTPGIFAFADGDRLRDVIASAGFSRITLEEMTINVVKVPDGQAYWEAMSDLAAPVMALVDQLDETARTAYISDVIASANSFRQGDHLYIKGTTWIASAEK